MPAVDMLHFKGLCFDNPLEGKSPVQIHAETLGVDLAAIRASGDVYKNGTLKFLLKSEHQIKPEQAQGLKLSLDDVINGSARSTVLPAGVAMEKLSMSPEEAQFLEERQFSAEEIARCILQGYRHEDFRRRSAGTPGAHALARSRRRWGRR